MPVINVEGVGRVTVGDEFTKLSPDQQQATVDEIASSWRGQPVPQRKEPGMADYADDAAKSFALAGMPKGVTGLMGLPGDVQGLMDAGVGWAGNKIGLPPPPQDPSRQPRVNLTPNTQQVRQGVQSVTGDFYKPQYLPGRVTESVGEMLPGAMMGPGGVVRNAVAFGVVPGVASQAAGEMTGDNPWAKGGAALASGGLMAMLTARGAGGAGSLVNQAAGRGENTIAPQVLQQAENIFQEAQQFGMPITRAEAIQFVTNGGTGFGQLQKLVEGHGGLNPFFAARGAQNEAAAGRTFDSITPVPTNAYGADGYGIGPAVGEAGQGFINDTRRVINNAAEPYYRQSDNIQLTPQEMQQALAIPGVPEAMRAVRGKTQLNRYVANLPDDSVGFMNAVKQYLDTAAENAARAINPAQNQKVAAGFGNDARDIREVALNASRRTPGNPYEAALGIESTARERYLQPLLDGPLGKLAGRDTTTQQAIEALFPSKNVTPFSADAIGTAVQALSQRNPTAARSVVRAHLEMKLNEATKAVARTDGSTAGAGFWKEIMGNPQSAQNIEAAVSALPGGNRVWPGVERFFTFLEAQSTRQAVGSNTAFYQAGQQSLKGGSVTGEIGSAAASGGFKAPARIKEAIESWRVGNNVDELARLLTDPAAGREFARLASANSPGAVNASVFRLTMLAKTGATQSGNQSSSPKN